MNLSARSAALTSAGAPRRVESALHALSSAFLPLVLALLEHPPAPAPRLVRAAKAGYELP